MTTPSTAIELISLRANGGGSVGAAEFAQTSGSGRYTVFGSTGTDLLGTGGGAKQVYLRDNGTGRISLVSRTVDGSAPSSDSTPTGISSDGLWVTYVSFATNIAGGNGTGMAAAYLFNTQTGVTTSMGAVIGTGQFQPAMISSNGRYVALVNYGGGTAETAIYRYDTTTGTATMAYSLLDSGDTFTKMMSISDGGTIVFQAKSPDGYIYNHVAGPEFIGRYLNTQFIATSADAKVTVQTVENGLRTGPLFTRFELTAQRNDFTGDTGLRRISQGDSDTSTSYTAIGTMDAAGRYVAYLSTYDYTVRQTTGLLELYVWDTVSGQVSKVVPESYDADLDTVIDPRMSADGQWITFSSTSAQLVSGDVNQRSDVFRVRNPYWGGVEPFHEVTITGGPLTGGGGADVLYGTTNDDTMQGGGGADRVFGFIGNDTLYGDAGADTLVGGDGDDTLHGGANGDVLWGDQLDGIDATAGGGDTLWGDDGNDTLHGGGGADWLHGGQDNDTLWGEAGDDHLYGDDGVDKLYGGAGRDDLDGGDGSDELRGGGGDDTLYGGAGDDRIWGNELPDSGDLDIVRYDGRPSDYIIQELMNGGDPYISVQSQQYGLDQVRNVTRGAFDALRNNVVSNTNIYMQLAEAAKASYDNVADMNEGWAPLSALELGLAPGGTGDGFTWTFHQGVYVARADAIGGQIEADAHVYFGVLNGKNTVLFAFRGTDDIARDGQDYPTMQSHYAKFQPLVDAVLGYIDNGGYVAGQSIDRVLVAGHSLGGAVAQLFMQDSRVFGDARYLGATWGAPGSASPQADPRMLQFEHQNDPVPYAGDAARGAASTTLGAVKEAATVLVSSPFAEALGDTLGSLRFTNPTQFRSSGGVVRLAYDNTTSPYDPVDPHYMANYVTDMAKLVAVQDRLPFMTQGAAALPPGTHTELAIGTARGEVLAGAATGFVQLMRGAAYTDGSEIFMPGMGADAMIGGLGRDIFLGTADELDGDTISDMAGGERIRVLGAVFTQADVFYLPDTAHTVNTLSINGIHVGIAGAHPGVFAVEAGDGYTDVVYHGGLTLAGGSGNDELGGGDGDDTVAGGFGNDYVVGGAGSDHLYGDAAPGGPTPGNGLLALAAGDDMLAGGMGADILTGGAGTDTFAGTLLELDGDEITDLELNERILLQDTTIPLPAGGPGPVVAQAAGAGTMLHIDADGDGTADIHVKVDRAIGFFTDPRRELTVTADLGGTAIALQQKQVSFAAPSQTGLGSRATTAAVGDLDGDGLGDLALGSDRSGTVTVRTGGGDGTFGVARTLETGLDAVRNLLAVDVDGDGRSDLVVVGDARVASDSDPVHGVNQMQVQVWRQGPGGTFSAPFSVDLANPARFYVEDLGGRSFAGDIDGDGLVDLVVAHETDGQRYTVSTLLGHAGGGFTAGTETRFDLYAGQATQLVDLNGDGRLDLLVDDADNTFGSGIYAALNDGQGVFGALVQLQSGRGGAAALDLNGDGLVDLALDGGRSVMLGTGSGQFREPQAAGKGWSGQAMLTGDLNHDGAADLLTYSTGFDFLPGSVTLVPELAGAPGRAKTLSLGEAMRWAGVADLNGDGRPDLVGVSGLEDGDAKAVAAINDFIDQPTGYAIAATDASKAEGTGAATRFTFTVTRNGDLSGPATVPYRVVGASGAPADAADFLGADVLGGVLPSGSVSFLPGQAAAEIGIDVAGDMQKEADEAFTVLISPPGAPTAAARGVIHTDDLFAYTTPGNGLSSTAAGIAYDGPVAGLEHQYIWSGTDGVAIRADAPNVFLKGGPAGDALMVTAGSNVLDGGGGSNFLVGGTGEDGGHDVFFVDSREQTETWSTVLNFHPGDLATIFGYHPGLSTRGETAWDGADGFKGYTLHSEIDGPGTGVRGSITFAGLDQSTAHAHLVMTEGTLPGGIDYLLVSYT